VKAAVFTRYGPPGDVVELRDVEMPSPNEGEVRIAIRAASINALDWRTVTGTPVLARLAMGLTKPKETRIGVDVAGVVDAVGANVTAFKPGDAVFGNCRGAFAEARCAPASALVAIPDGVGFEEAASLPVASFTALQALRAGNIAAGRSVLVNGAAGGVGTFAVKLAKAFGARVTAVTHTRNLDFVRSLGADDVIDYMREDFADGNARYDLIIDCHATRALRRCRRMLTPDGTYLAIGAPFTGMMDLVALLLKCALLSKVRHRKVRMVMAKRNPGDLVAVMQLVKDRKVVPAIDRRFPLDDIREAIAYVADGHARGKVVVTMPASMAPR